MTLTREEAASKAAQVLQVDVAAYPHAELEADLLCGGYAFTGSDRAAVIGYRGGYQSSMTDLSGETVETLIVGWLAEQRHLYGVSDGGNSHACPICGAVTSHTDRYPRSVCTACESRASNQSGRRIVGYNEGLAGGLIVFYAKSPTGPQSEIAGDVMESGICWIDGIKCSIGEARYGGVVIERLSER